MRKSLGMTQKAYRNLLALLMGLMSMQLYMTLMLLYVPFQNCFGLTNTQIASLLSVYSITTVPFSIIGGRISDAVSPKLCVYGPCFITGLLGILMCFDPSYPMLLAVFALLPIGSIAWPSIIKCMKYLSPSNDKLGKVFGMANVFGGIVSSVEFLSFVLIFGEAIGDPNNFRIIIWVNNIMSLASGFIVLFLFDYKWVIENSSNYTVSEPMSFAKSFTEAVKVPEVWAVGALSIVYYGITCIVNYTSPYLINGFGFPVAYTTMFAIVTRYILRGPAGSVGGRYRDGKGAMYKALKPWSVMSSAIFLAMAFLPMKPSMIVPACLLGSGLIFIYTMASTGASMTLTEYNPPANLHATMTAIVTIVGNLGTVIVSNICGRILDAQPVAGYRYCFLIGIVIEMIFLFSDKMLAFCAGLPHTMAKNREDHAFDSFVKE
ncbi:MAG: MFS transporter [Firmicutes bacterium]|nr:MFS transporter [Bacillota bacterium]